MWYNEFSMKRSLLLLVFLGLFLGLLLVLQYFLPKNKAIEHKIDNKSHWFVLYRKSQKEELYYGIPGDKTQSKLVKTFLVKTGRSGERPTPLPQLLGKEYWVIIDKMPTTNNPETAPYFLTLNIPAPSIPPYGPKPYNECNGEQCDWILPGAFGLHGTAGDPERLAASDPGSSGCIRHSDEDITYLYNLLDPKKEEIRYYIEDK